MSMIWDVLLSFVPLPSFLLAAIAKGVSRE
jgi:hypothetical protein